MYNCTTECIETKLCNNLIDYYSIKSTILNSFSSYIWPGTSSIIIKIYQILKF